MHCGICATIGAWYITVPSCACFIDIQQGVAVLAYKITRLEMLVLRINTLGPSLNGRHFADDIFKCIFLNENVWISIEISLKFVRKGSINNIPASVLIMAWRRPGDKPLSGAIMVRLPTHICVTRPQWVKTMLSQSVDWHTVWSDLFVTSGFHDWA